MLQYYLTYTSPKLVAKNNVVAKCFGHLSATLIMDKYKQRQCSGYFYTPASRKTTRERHNARDKDIPNRSAMFVGVLVYTEY